MEVLNEFFSTLSPIDSQFILFTAVASFLLGFLVAYLLRGSKIRRLTNELKAKQKELDDASAMLVSVREQLELKDADIRRANFEIEELRAKVARLEEEKNSLYNDVLEATADQEKVKVSIQNYLSTIESLNEQIVGLKSQNNQLTDEIEDDSIKDNIQLIQIQNDYEAQRKRLAVVEQKLGLLVDENQNLKEALDDLKENTEKITVVERVIEPAPLATTNATSAEIEEPTLVVSSEKELVHEKIIIDDTLKDDLTLIKNLGPFLEKKLNSVGISTYQQISEWGQADIDRVTEEIAYFPGRIQKDKWVEQAKELLNMKTVSPDKLKEKTKHPKDPEDLKIIEGIGPKIEQILKDADINDWEDLADATPKYLENILAEAGDRFKMHDPGTWPTQARLAARGEWNLLKDYQEDLKGGREVKD